MVLVGGSGTCRCRMCHGAAGKQVLYFVRAVLDSGSHSPARRVAAGRGMWQVSHGCLVCLYRRESH